MHNCSRCRRVLINSSRDALCLRCLYVVDRGRAFDDEPDTKPGTRGPAAPIDNADAGAVAA